jgi:hypothetical protein
MFILRRITSENIEINTCLGDYYVFVSRERNVDEFKRTVKLWSEDDTEDVYAVVTYNDGSNIMPLYKKSHYYVMASDGRTFANISEKV